MVGEPFPFKHPLGSASQGVALIEAPDPEIGDVVWGYSTLALSAPKPRPWWHPLRNPGLTAGGMLFTLFIATSAAREGAGVAIAVIVIGYLAIKGLAALGGPSGGTNFFVGAHGMSDVLRRKGETSRRSWLWKDIDWWGTTPERMNGKLYVRHVQLDERQRLLDHINPFGFRFTLDPQSDPESAMYAHAHQAWLKQKLGRVSQRLSVGESIDMPLLATQNAGRLVTGVRPASFVRVAPEEITVSVDGRVVFQAPRSQVTLRWEHRPSVGRRDSTDVHCLLQAGTGSWSSPRYEFPGADVLADLVRVER